MNNHLNTTGKTNNNTNSTSRAMSDLIEKSAGQFLSVTFIKKDGTLRELVGKKSSIKDNHGGERTVSEDKYLLLKEKGTDNLRNVNRDTILKLRCRGMEVQNVDLIAKHNVKFS